MGDGVAEEGRVDRRRKDDRDVHATRLVRQFGTYAVGKTAHGSLGAGVGCQERQAVIGNGRAHIDDRAAVARHHTAERHAGAIDRPTVSHIRHTVELARRHVNKPAIDAIAGAVDPGGARSERALDIRRRGFQLRLFAYVSHGKAGAATRLGNLLLYRGQARRTAGNQADAPAPLRKQRGRAASNAGRGANDDDRQCFLRQRLVHSE